MFDNEITPNDNDRTDLVREALANIRIELAPVEIPASIGSAKKIPLSSLALAGGALTSLSPAFRTITQTITVPNDGTLLKAYTADGIPLRISDLQAFKKPGTGALGSQYTNGSFSQAHLFKADAQAFTSTTILPIDPVTLATAIAIADINKKLDGIQKTVGEILDYLKLQKQSELQAALQTLVDALNDYGVNCSNERYMGSAHEQVLAIKRLALEQLNMHRPLVESKLSAKAPMELRAVVESRMDAALDELKQYQLATYTYCFSVFMDPMLSDNFSHAKLETTVEKIRKASLEYRELYTKCYDAIESSARDSVDNALLGSVASAGKALSKVVAATPVGDHTPIDEALKGAGNGLDKFNSDQNNRLLEKLREAKSPDVFAFQEHTEFVDDLYNKPSSILTDGQNLYLVPEDESMAERR